MTAARVDITPRTDYISAIQEDDWNAKGAISELVANSFGSARGDASVAWIKWNPRTRELWVIDDGRGMRDVADLFQLGKTAGRSHRDIGKYGAGGTMACMWLASEVKVWTLRDGQTSSTTVVWDEWKRRGDWGIFVEPWTRATLRNTPSTLIDLRHGTLIRLKVRREKRFPVEAIKRELAKTFAPGLRFGKRVRWEAISGRGGRVEDLVSPQVLSNPQQWDVVVAVHGKRLSASVTAGIDQALTIDESQIEICYGPQVIKSTRACYASPDGEISYSGVGVKGWVDLGEGFQDFFTTTKTDFNDAGVEDALYGCLFAKLEPLLQEVEQSSERAQLETIALNLSVDLEGAFDVDVKVAPQRTEPTYTWTKTDKGEVVPQIKVTQAAEDEAPGDVPKTSRAATTVWIEFLDAARMVGLWDVKIDATSIRVFLDKDNAHVKEARMRRSPTQERLLSALFVPGVAQALLELEPKHLRKILQPGVITKIEDIDSAASRLSFLTRHILSNTKTGAVA